MRSVEANGKTMQEAREAALQQLQLTEDEVIFEVVEEPAPTTESTAAEGVYRVRATPRSEGEGSPKPDDEGSDDEPIGAPPVRPIVELGQGDTGNREQIVALRAREFLSETTRLMGLQTDVVCLEAQPGEVTLEIRGEGLGLLIGRHGTTLDALQLLAAVVGNADGPEGVRIMVDAENYRERRRELLRKMALTQAQKAKEAQQEVVIPDLKAFERRIIHLTLKDDPEVETYSEGEGEDRCIVISPRAD